MHLTETQINDWLDGALSEEERAAADRHLASCADCRAELEACQQIIQRVQRLPAAIPPERDLRRDVWAQIDRRSLWHWRYPLAAAAVLLIAVSSVLTVLLTRPAHAPVGRSTSVQPATVELVGLEAYRTEIATMQAALREHRAQLAPETVRILEENLSIIDRAIQEARQALASDPQSTTLNELLRSAYQRKLDLLKQAARSSAAT